MESIRFILVVGLDVVALASSVRNAGYTVFSLDYFGDSDLKRLSLINFSVLSQKEDSSYGRLSKNYDPNDFLVLIKSLLKNHSVDGILLSSGLEDYPRILSALNDLAPIIGNSPKTISRVRDREYFFKELHRVKVPHPETYLVETYEEAKEKARKIGYPIVLKPEKSFGGYGLKRVSRSDRLRLALRSIQPGEKFLIQEYVQGTAASASIISTASESLMLTVNEQILGKRSLGQKEPFGYCGNIVPLKISKSILKECSVIAEKVVRHFHLVGSNGIDFVITEDGLPKVIEVNPRFQGTLECIERVLDINIAKAHIQACTLGVLPKTSDPKDFSVRLILYTLKRSRVPSLHAFEGIRDLPFPGVIIEKNEPLCSIVTEGSSRSMALQKAKRLARDVYRSLQLHNREV